MKVGDYVRTKWGYICKIVNINDFREPSMKYGVEASYLKDIMFIGEEDIIKSNPNIIDLIEVGDYVNGKRVEWIGYKLYQDNGKECKGIGDKIILFNEFTKDYISEKNIKSIVTKEQFESMEYKVGE